MVDHAFGTLGLHRIALYVFEFNERAIRAYRRCGFVIEGRSRESIWRDGRWWDELAMSVLESDWRAGQHDAADADADGVERRVRADAPATAPSRSGPGRRTCFDGRSGGGDDDRGRGGRRPPVPTCASSSRPRATPWTTPGRSWPGWTRRSRPATWTRTPSMDLYLGDLMRALEQDDGEKLGGKSAEAARFILRAIDRELDNA